MRGADGNNGNKSAVGQLPCSDPPSRARARRGAIDDRRWTASPTRRQPSLVSSPNRDPWKTRARVFQSELCAHEVIQQARSRQRSRRAGGLIKKNESSAGVRRAGRRRLHCIIKAILRAPAMSHSSSAVRCRTAQHFTRRFLSITRSSLLLSSTPVQVAPGARALAWCSASRSSNIYFCFTVTE